MTYQMVAEHANWPKKDDVIFGLAARAKKAIEVHGKDSVIDSTLGALVDDEGKLICFDTVYDELRTMPAEKIAGYAQVAGQPGYLEAVQDACFGPYRPDAHIRAVATPGGAGAVRHAVWSYTNPGDTFIVFDWFWTAYQTIAEEFGRKIDTYPLFDEKGGYNLSAFKEKFESILEKQDRILAVFNTPANNPTGYSIADEEWDEIIEFVKEKAENSDKRITLLLDVAYIDFAGIGDERRKFFKKFSNLPKNVFVVVAYTMSKGYSMYGMRSGAAIGISSMEEIAEEFFYSCYHANRANWSNGVRAPMEIMININGDEAKKAAYEKEVSDAKKLLRTRADAFVGAAEEVGLEILPYRDGFFVSIPCENSTAISEELIKENLFVVPLKAGLRFAVCAVSAEKCKTVPKMIKKALDGAK